MSISDRIQINKALFDFMIASESNSDNQSEIFAAFLIDAAIMDGYDA